MTKTKDTATVPEAHVSDLTIPTAGEQQHLALDKPGELLIDALNSIAKVESAPKTPKPTVKMFEVPIGGEVVMPTGEILQISVFYPKEVQPARVGVYVTEQDDSVIDSEALDGMVTIGFSHWDGHNWGPQFQTPESASANHGAAKWPPKPWAALLAEHPDNAI
ncbi:hypothetical protein D3C87_687510 [compost metagenome]